MTSIASFRTTASSASNPNPLQAFISPSHNPCTPLLLSRWYGTSVCQPRITTATPRPYVNAAQCRAVHESRDTDNTNAEIAEGDVQKSLQNPYETSGEKGMELARSRSEAIFLFIAGNAIQAMLLAVAIVGASLANRSPIARLIAILSSCQLCRVPNLVWRGIRSSDKPQLVLTNPLLLSSEGLSPENDNPPSVTARGKEAEEEKDDNEEFAGGLSGAQSKLISTSIRATVVEEVDSVRGAIERIEQKAEHQQNERNRVIAEAIASLDENIRLLRRSVDTRNQVEKSAPLALVTEMEIMKSRLKQAEEDKAVLEARLRVAENNFEEAKRQGERAHQEADEAKSREFNLRTELAVSSSRLIRLEELTERLDRAERKNDELQEQIVSRTREQESLRQSEADAKRRVLRVENIARILRQKVQEVTSKPLQSDGKDEMDLFGGIQEKSEEQFWPQRLRGKGDLRPDSVVYQELLRREQKSQSPQFPRDPLGMEQNRDDPAKPKMLPDDGGFGTAGTFADAQTSDSQKENKLLSSKGSPDKIFSFSRGEFDDSKRGKGIIDQSENDLEQTANWDSDVPIEPSNTFEALQDTRFSEASSKVSDRDDALQLAGTEPFTDLPKKGEDIENRKFVDSPKSNVSAEVMSDDKSHDAAAVEPFVREEVPRGTQTDDDTHSQLQKEDDQESDEIIEAASITSLSESVGENNFRPSQQKQVSDKIPQPESAAQPEPENVEDSVESDKVSSSYQREIELQDSVGRATEVMRNSELSEKVEISESSKVMDPRGDDFDESEKSPNSSEATRDSEKIGIYEDVSSNKQLPNPVSAKPNADPLSRQTLSTSGLSSNDSNLDEVSIEEEGINEPSTTVYSNAEATTHDSADYEPSKVVQRTSSYLEHLSQSREPKQSETIDDHLRTARELVKKARTKGLAVKLADTLFAKATKNLEEGMKETGNPAEVEAELGGCLLAWAKIDIANPLSRERLSRALNLLQSSLESQSQNETFLFNTGLCLCLVASTGSKQEALENYKAACEIYERLLQLNDKSRIACFNCGLSYVSLARLRSGEGIDETSKSYFERAAVLFQRSLELKPGDGKAISYLDDCKRQLERAEAS